MTASETRDRGGRIRGYIVAAAIGTVIGVAASTGARFHTHITGGVLAALFIAGLALGPKAVKREDD